MQTHDLIVIGAGMAGLNAVGRAAGDGRRIAVIERSMFGGTCPTRGCIPTKALIRSAEIAHEARRASEFGVHVGDVTVDFGAVMERVRTIVQQGSDGSRRWVESLAGVEIVEGDATFSGPTTISVDERELVSDRIVVATGAAPSVPPIPGLDRVPFWTSDDLLRATELPQRLLIVGAGPIALELGQAMRRLGSEVTMVEVAPTLLPRSEPELVGLLRGYLADEGIAIHTDATIQEVRTGPELVVHVDGETRTLRGDVLLIATGRAAAVDGLGLEAANVRGDHRGVGVDAHLATAADGIYAAGDVVGLPYGAFTHVARRMGITAADNALALSPHPADQDVGPTAIFTDPELTAVGMTEREARDAGHEVGVASSGFSGGKARAWGEERGMVKVIVDRPTRRILGAHILAYHGADLIHPIAVAMRAPGGSVDPVLEAFHVHPTLGEVVQAAAKSAIAEVLE
jgi:pyruvate/2-oxoglutarate dehydrogenase complex dihydrolipoamide dehydrogenase (E3) component